MERGQKKISQAELEVLLSEVAANKMTWNCALFINKAV